MSNRTLLVIHDGMNEKHSDFIEKKFNKEGVSIQFFPFLENDIQSEKEAEKTVIQELHEFPGAAITVLFAVSVGESIIPEVVKYVDRKQVIHIDYEGKQFAI